MDILDELLVETSASLGGENPQSPPKGVIQKVSYSHQAMIDMILAQPGISQNALAARFGYTASWVSQVMSSDTFKAAFAARSKEVLDPVLLLTVQERFEAMVVRSQEILMEKLSKSADVVPDQLAIAALNAASRAMGYGARPEAPKAEVNIDVYLADVGDRLTGLLRRKRSEVVDAQLDEITSGA